MLWDSLNETLRWSFLPLSSGFDIEERRAGVVGGAGSRGGALGREMLEVRRERDGWGSSSNSLGGASESAEELGVGERKWR